MGTAIAAGAGALFSLITAFVSSGSKKLSEVRGQAAAKQTFDQQREAATVGLIKQQNNTLMMVIGGGVLFLIILMYMLNKK